MEDVDHAPRITPSRPLKLAIVGRPNVGKSSIINALTRSERVVVSPIPGTTRDAVDVPFEVETDGVRQSYVLIDTAGMRKTRRVDDSIEFFSVKRAEDSIARCDIVVLVLDAEAGITEQDKRSPTRSSRSAGPACVVNKWDLMDEAVRKGREEEIARRQREEGRRGAQPPDDARRVRRLGAGAPFFLDYAPVIFTSAKSGFHLDRLLEAVRYVAAQLQQNDPDGDSESHLAGCRRAPPTRQRARPSPEVLLRDAGEAGAARPSCFLSAAMNCSRPV